MLPRPQVLMASASDSVAQQLEYFMSSSKSFVASPYDSFRKEHFKLDRGDDYHFESD